MLSAAAAQFGLATSSLLFLEVMGIAGYSTRHAQFIFYSMDSQEAMQKPSLGFDYVQRFSKETSDFAVLAVQGRLALNAEGNKTLEPQLYNAYLKIKGKLADFWAGHNRPALGLSSYLDSHALLLQTLAMNGFGFDRDWGIGLSRDLSWGDAAASLTLGSGMPVYFKGNFLFSARVSKGILYQENFNIGFSAAWGKTLETMGYHLMSPEPRALRMAGLDITYLFNNLENRMEILAGERDGRSSYALFWRTGINLAEEGRWKLEAQPVFWKTGDKTNCEVSSAVTFRATPDVTLRAMGLYDHEMRDFRAVFQVYFYKIVR